MPKKIVRKSAVKNHLQSERARLRHKSRKSAIATTEKKLRGAIAAKDKSSALEILKAEQAILDKAVKAGTIHRNKADRKKGRLAAAIAAMDKAPKA